MDAEIKTKWVAALRGGEFKQGERRLRDGDAYCCLGVLCVVTGLQIDSDGKVVVDARGNPVSGYRLLEEIIGHRALPLWEMNDKGASFPEIANYIEANL